MDHALIGHVTERFMALRDIRLSRLREPLPERRREVLDLLPLLFHMNHPHLPAYVGGDVPAGLPGYVPDRDAETAARKHLRGQQLGGAARRDFVLRGLYLMGSSGTLGQDWDSDFDLWLIHDDALQGGERQRLAEKARAVEAWARSRGVEVHVFLMHAAGFRSGEKGALSNDASGQTQHLLLLEEFYRTAVLLAGHPPLWWLIPPQHDGAGYQAQVEHLEGQLGVHLQEWIDLGPLGEISADEFFSSAHWQLHKGIDAPYKSVLKLMLIEAYAAQYPRVGWLSDQLKQAVYGEQELDPDRLDPYRLLLDRISEHLVARDEPDRLELARRSLYLKTGMRLSGDPGRTDWRADQLRQLTRQWEWDERHLTVLDRRREWPLERVMEERDALVAELTRSYRMLTEFARARGSDMQRNGRELSLLGRRLYAAMERHPGKIDLINPGSSVQLAEEQLWICRHASGIRGGHWRLYRRPPGVLGTEARPLKTATSLVEMLAWLYLNQLTATTRLQLLPRPADGGVPEFQRILQVLEKRLGEPALPDVPISAFADQPQAVHSLAFVNVAPAPELELQVPIGVPQADRSPVDNVEHLMITNWGEVLVHSHDDGLEGLLDSLCQHLNMTRHTGMRAVPLHANSFSSGDADAVARRISELSETGGACFAELGERARFVFELLGNCYLIEQAEQGLQWLQVGDREDLMQLLQEPLNRFRPTRLDPRKLSDLPLVRLFAENVDGLVQVFYRTTVDGVEMFCLDDCGALFHQHYENISEPVFLAQQQRLFATLTSRRMLASSAHAGEMLAGGTRFYRLAVSPEGWTARPVQPPAEGQGQQLGLQLVTSRDGLAGDNFSLVVGEREFDALRLGAGLYTEVAAFVLAQRRPGQDYPVRITGVLPAGLEEGAGWTVNEMLRTKRRIERRLTAAMRQLARQRSRRPA